MIKIRERKNGSAGTDVTNYYIRNCKFYKKNKILAVSIKLNRFLALTFFIFSQIARYWDEVFFVPIQIYESNDV
jgi:hypothetical protein